MLREAGLDDQVRAAVAAIELPATDTIVAGIRETFGHAPESAWRDHVEIVAARLTGIGTAEPAGAEEP
jgi:hypothetical protein